MISKIQIKRDTSVNWVSVNPILAQGELGLELGANNIKCGDGITAWVDLEYLFDNVGTTTATTDTYIKNVSATSNVFTLNLNDSRYFEIETLDTIAKSITFSNVPSQLSIMINVSVLLKYTNAATISYPASVVWQNNTTPTLVTGTNYILDFTTFDNGTTWKGVWVESWY